MSPTPTDSLAGTTFAPTQWPWALASRPHLSSDAGRWSGALLRSWRGTSPLMEQPPLDQHYVVMHLGGAKRVNRRCDGPPLSTVADTGSLTIVPAGTSYVWRTEGPIAFAHLYLPPASLERFGGQVPGHDACTLSLVDRVACRDPPLEMTFQRMLAEIQRPASSPLLLDSLLENFCVHLARRHVAAAIGKRAAQAESLAPHRLRRVIEFIDAHLGDDVALADLVEAAGTSQFHFSRAFRLTTGLSPYRYLTCRRIEYARVLLLASGEPLGSVGARCGFNSQRQFAAMFKKALGVGPKRFRLLHR